MPNVETALQFRSDVMRGLQDPSPANMQYAFNLMQVRVMAHDKKCQVFCMIPGDPGVVDFTKGIELATRIEFPPSRSWEHNANEIQMEEAEAVLIQKEGIVLRSGVIDLASQFSTANP